MTFFRYPGGKAKLRNVPLQLSGISLAEHLNLYAFRLELEYREPFFGGGSIGTEFLFSHPRWRNVWLNDKDRGLACLWTAVTRYPKSLWHKVRDFVPSVESFDRFKRLLADVPIPETGKEIVEYGFMKMALHQISYSGLGMKSGGPLGGRLQESKYPIDCRWSPEYLRFQIIRLCERFRKSELRFTGCTNFDFSELILDQRPALLYLDPPYYVKGNDLYQCGFTERDHRRLATLLHFTRHSWVLSYDDCPEVRDLYEWAVIEEVDVNYSITATKDKESGARLSRTKPELVIYPTHHQDFVDSCRNILGFIETPLRDS